MNNSTAYILLYHITSSLFQSEMPSLQTRKSMTKCSNLSFSSNLAWEIGFSASKTHKKSPCRRTTCSDMQLQLFVVSAFTNALHLLLFNIFCLQLAPVPEKEPRLSTALTRVSVKEGEQGRAGDSEREDVWRKKMQSMAKEVWYFTQVSGTDEGRRFKSRDLDRAGILVTFPAGHPQWSSEPQAHHKQVTLQKWRPGTPGRTRPITWRNTNTKISIQKGETNIKTARKSRVGICIYFFFLTKNPPENSVRVFKKQTRESGWRKAQKIQRSSKIKCTKWEKSL